METSNNLLRQVYGLLKEMGYDVKYIDELTLVINIKTSDFNQLNIIIQLDPTIRKIRFMVPTNFEVRSAGKLLRLLRHSFDSWKYFYAIDPEYYVIVICDTYFTDVRKLRVLIERIINYVIEGVSKLEDILGT